MTSISELFDTEEGFLFQINTWNFAYTGHDINNFIASLAENGSGLHEWVWDRGAVDIALDMVSIGDEDYRPVKDWIALPWVAEHCVRGHEPWPGI